METDYTRAPQGNKKGSRIGFDCPYGTHASGVQS